MANKILNDKELKVILNFLKIKIPYINRIGLTGSYATGLQTLKSDLDIVIDIDINHREDFWVVAEDVRSFLINEYMLPVDFIFYSDVKHKIKSCQSLSACDVLESQMYEELLNKVRWEGGVNGEE